MVATGVQTLIQMSNVIGFHCSIIGASLSEPHTDDFALEFVYNIIIILCIYIYIYIVHRAINHFRLLFCEFLHHSLIQKLFTNYSARRHEQQECSEQHSVIYELL